MADATRKKREGTGDYRDLALAPHRFDVPAVAIRKKTRQARAEVHLGAARRALAGFQRGGHVFGLNKGQFSMIDIAAAVLEHTGPARVSVWTWCVADYEVEAFGAFAADGAIQSLRVVMDWAGLQRNLVLVESLQSDFGTDCVRVTMTHAKMITAATDDGWRVTVRGSMNLNANPRFEQFDVSDDAAVYDVVAGLERELWQRAPALDVETLAHRDAVALFDANNVESVDEVAEWRKAVGRGWWKN